MRSVRPSAVLVRPAETYEAAEVARRAAVSVDDLRRLVQLRIVEPDADGRVTAGHVRRVGLVTSLVAAGTRSTVKVGGPGGRCIPALHRSDSRDT